MVSGEDIVVGSIGGRAVVIVDDLISTGTTFARAAAACRAAGAVAIYATVTHGLCTDEADRVVRAAASSS